MKTAVFWDVENVKATKINLDDIERFITKLAGKSGIYKCASLNCFSVDKKIMEEIYEAGYELEYIPMKKKNGADKILIRKAEERSMLDKDIEVYVFITHDSDFKNTINKLKNMGKCTIILHSGNKMKKSFIRVPNFIFDIKESCPVETIKKTISSNKETKKLKEEKEEAKKIKELKGIEDFKNRNIKINKESEWASIPREEIKNILINIKEINKNGIMFSDWEEGFYSDMVKKHKNRNQYTGRQLFFMLILEKKMVKKYKNKNKHNKVKTVA